MKGGLKVYRLPAKVLSLVAGMSALTALAFYQAPPPLSPSDFTPAAECGRCHQEIYSQWSQSMHSRSFTDPVYRAVLDKVLERTEGKNKAFCLSCHSPIASVTGETLRQPVPLQWDQFGSLAQEGVTCDFCHTISGQEMLGRNISVSAYVYPRRGKTQVKYGRHDTPPNESHMSQSSDFLTSSEVCAICHQFKHPVSLRETQNTYREWLEGPYSGRGVRCQDCHMPAYSGATAKGAPERERVHAHVFLGGRSQMLNRAATVTVWGVRQGNEIQVAAGVRNSGAGHTIPTGVPGIREMRLEVKVLSPEGEVLHRREFRYGQRPLTREGRKALPWEDFETLEDNRIAPEQSRQERFTVSLPQSASGPLRLKADLFMYRLAPELIEALQVPAQDPILMTSVEASVSMSEIR